jgi:hypothetical protein
MLEDIMFSVFIAIVVPFVYKVGYLRGRLADRKEDIVMPPWDTPMGREGE